MNRCDNPLISVIVPVYNCGLYLNACLDSILAQTIQSVEIICVDDGSTDDSGKIIDDYAQKYDNIIVEHIRNSGVSAARNRAVTLSKGKYLMFCDSDDTFAPDMCQILYDAVTEGSCDMARCSHRMHKPGFERICHSPLENGVYSKDEMTEKLLMHMIGPTDTDELNRPSLYSANLWCYIIKRSIITENDIKFPVTLFSGEDTMFVMECLFNSNGIVSVDKPLYNYLLRDGSAVRRYNPKIIDNTFEYISLLDELTQKYGFFEKTETNRRFNKAKYANYLAENILNRNNPAKLKDKISLLKSAYENKLLHGCFDILDLNRLSLKIRVFYHCLVKRRYRTYHFLRNLRSRLR